MLISLRLLEIGLYFFAALMEICSAYLQTLSGSALREWFHLLRSGDKAWLTAVPGFDDSNNMGEDKWTCFLNGWIYAAAGMNLRIYLSIVYILFSCLNYLVLALLRSSPRAFREAVNDTEKWIQSTQFNQRFVCHKLNMKCNKSHSSLYDNDIPESDKFFSPKSQHDSSNTSYFEEDDVEGEKHQEKPTIRPEPRDQSSENDPFKFLDSFLNMAPPTSPTKDAPSTRATNSSLVSRQTMQINSKSQWPHDCKSGDSTMCLWTGPKEVPTF
jgi:hypothetical protein